MVISLVASKISLIFAPVIRQVKSGCGRDYFFHYYSAEQMEKPKSCESAIKIVGNELLTLNMLTTQKKCLFLHLYFTYLKENL